MATSTLDPNGNAVVNGYSTNLKPSAITPEMLQAPAAIIPVTTTPYDPTIHTNVTNGVVDQINADATAATNAAKQAQANQDAQGNAVVSALASTTTGKQAYTQDALNQTGYNQAQADIANYNTQLADINARAASLKRSNEAIPIQNQGAYQGTAGTQGTVTSVNRDQLTQNALTALKLGQEADIANAGLTGSKIRLEAAQQKAQQMVDLKYQPLEAELAVRQKQYDMNKASLEAVNKTKAEAVQAKITKDKEDLAQKKADYKTMNDDLLKAKLGGIPADLASTVQQGIDNGTLTPAKVTQMIGQYTATVPASAQEYQYAVNHGYKGSYSQYQTEDANRKAIIAKSNSTSPKTLVERQATVLSQFSNAFTPGAKLKDGTPVIDQSGFITPKAWKAAIQDAPAEGLTRAQFIKEFGHLLYADANGVSASYGITPSEKKLIGQ